MPSNVLRETKMHRIRSVPARQRIRKNFQNKKKCSRIRGLIVSVIMVTRNWKNVFLICTPCSLDYLDVFGIGFALPGIVNKIAQCDDFYWSRLGLGSVDLATN